MPSDPIPTLQLSPEEMRALGYRVVDMIVDEVAHLHERPVAGGAPRAEMEARLREPAPAAGVGWEAALERARRDVLGPMSPPAHPRFFAYVPSPGNFVGAMADALASGFNPFAGAWATAAGAAECELVTVDWLREACGLPQGAGGAFVSGGSMANLTALAVARHRRFGTGGFAGAVIYASDQTHSSIARGARVLGFEPGQLRLLPSTADFRLDVRALAVAIGADARAGRTPFAVVANAGTTNTGAVDPLPEIARICREAGVWMHVDGAYGAAAALTGAGRALLAGLGEADSISMDPHKWLFQPFECGAVLVRDARALRDTFREVPEYLRDSDVSAEEVNFRDWGVQLTRGFRAFKLWLSIQTFGMDAFRAAIDWGIRQAEIAEEELRSSDDWEILTPARLGIVTFRWRGVEMEPAAGDDLQRRATAAMTRSGWAMLSTTELRGRAALRLCTINPRTTEDDVRETVRRLGRIARELAEG
ncbi:pyridoxal phosphate-dependent decarboxylase family protein [Longimicrobium sp.]|uniref:pyridoxal phosphate-dependent decarboxylase family protein n=1 Tax=Longimicrobium sp. TaxID=2029185 RepID=UPI002C87B9C3|nr:aminotransferase class I/II-fold pyridoxal phosphate-dependent enzyme [Longimicrobium sp.]HSU17027.1 aminotransferase class I/II-fold pyridoxal phosphate-dependent enzyme [Longimicrobium sp.]